MRHILIIAAALAISGVAGAAHAQAPTVQPCPVTPCTANGIPPAAAGGQPGSGPADLRTKPQDSPVATGAGGGSSDSGGSKSGGGGSSSSGGK